MNVKKTILFGCILAIIAFALKVMEYGVLAHDFSIELCIGFVALLFCGLGAWTSRRLTDPATRHRSPTADFAPESPAAHPAVVPATLSCMPEFGLSPREIEVLRLIANGHSNQEIADALFLSLNTIKKHSSSLFAKMEVKRRTQAIEKAKRLGII